MLGLPFNIASYGLLLLLLAKEANMIPGVLMGSLGDVHIYENHKKGALEQIQRKTRELPKLNIPKFTNIFDREYTDIHIENYNPHPTIPFEIAV